MTGLTVAPETITAPKNSTYDQEVTMKLPNGMTRRSLLGSGGGLVAASALGGAVQLVLPSHANAAAKVVIQ